MWRRLLGAGWIAMLAACGGGEGSSNRVVLQNKGSDTIVNVAQAWAEAYRKVDPNVAIAVSGGGSGTGIAALINGTVDIASASRTMKESELAQAKERGTEPVEHVVGHDALAVFLHPNNPLKEVSLAQLRAIYGEGGAAEKWSDLGVTVPGCKSDEIIRVSRQNNSGTFVYFKEVVLPGGEYKLGSRDMHGSKDVADLVEKTPCAIGYSGLAYANEHVSMPCVSQEGGPCVAPSVSSAADHSYPISRPLLMYTNGEAEGPVKRYIDWILSDPGQCILLEKGYAPVRAVTCGA